MRLISQAEFPDLVEKLRLNPRQALMLRMYIGIDDVPVPYCFIAKTFKVHGQAVRNSIIKIAPDALDLIPDLDLSSRRLKPKGVYNFLRLRGMMTKVRAEKIIGTTIGISQRQEGYYRVACFDCNEEILTETGRNIPAALDALVRANYAKSRAFVLKRDSYRCVNCGALKNLTCDHKLSRARGHRDDRPENLMTLCVPCHDIRHRAKGFHYYVKGGERRPRRPEYGFSGPTE